MKLFQIMIRMSFVKDKYMYTITSDAVCSRQGGLDLIMHKGNPNWPQQTKK